MRALVFVAVATATAQNLTGEVPINHYQTPPRRIRITVSDRVTRTHSTRCHLQLNDLPAPYATHSAIKSPRVVPIPADAHLNVPNGFQVQVFADSETVHGIFPAIPFYSQISIVLVG